MTGLKTVKNTSQTIKIVLYVHRVENVLWRIKNGEFDFNCRVKAVVLFVGTNNTDCTPHEIFEGILEIVKEIKQRLGNVIIMIPVRWFESNYKVF